MKFFLILLLSVLFFGVQSVPVVPYNFQLVCLQRSKACSIDDSCNGDRTDISRILEKTGLSFSDFVSMNPLLGQILPTGSLPDATMVCVSAIWQGHN